MVVFKIKLNTRKRSESFVLKNNMQIFTISIRNTLLLFWIFRFGMLVNQSADFLAHKVVPHRFVSLWLTNQNLAQTKLHGISNHHAYDIWNLCPVLAFVGWLVVESAGSRVKVSLFDFFRYQIVKLAVLLSYEALLKHVNN